MSDYTQLQNAISTWFSWATGMPAVWENEPRQHLIMPYGVFSGPTSIASDGQDYVKYTWTGTKMQASVKARRQGDVGLRIISDQQSPGNARAGWLLELFRQSAVLPDVTAALCSADLALSSVNPTVQYDAPGHGQRMTSIQGAVLRMLWGPSALQPTTDYGVIRSISGTVILDSGAPYVWSAGP